MICLKNSYLSTVSVLYAKRHFTKWKSERKRLYLAKKKSEEKRSEEAKEKVQKAKKNVDKKTAQHLPTKLMETSDMGFLKLWR